MIAHSDPAWRRIEELAHRVFTLAGFPDDLAEDPSSDEFLQEADAIVSHVEINNEHGVGVLLARLFGGQPNIIAVRSRDLYGGRQEFAGVTLRISHCGAARSEQFRNVLGAMQGHGVARILCVPYYPDDARTAIALREIYNAPLCAYIMDDQNVAVQEIPDELMRELLEQSRLRLAVSPELASAYEDKYGLKIGLMPPVAPDRLILREPAQPPDLSAPGVIVGNIWGRLWLSLLRETLRDSGETLFWYSNSHFRFLSADREGLLRDSLIVPEELPLDDDDLVRALRAAPFAVVPSGTLTPDDDRGFIARLSLPSRIPFILATSHAPLVVLGDARTAAARFVDRHGIGLVCPYETRAFQAAAARLRRPEVNERMRRNALAIAPRYSDRGASEWIWASLAAGQPIDDRYGLLLQRFE
ncbi:MAG: hypothetical protein KIT09_06885 [Bryobacteraceae bacterium]|nr:hypothetical protein [Bryobacteraceae bacterium]